MSKKRTLREILIKCICQCTYRKNVSPNNYKMYRKETIDSAEAEIRALFKSPLTEKPEKYCENKPPCDKFMLVKRNGEFVCEQCGLKPKLEKPGFCYAPMQVKPKPEKKYCECSHPRERTCGYCYCGFLIKPKVPSKNPPKGWWKYIAMEVDCAVRGDIPASNAGTNIIKHIEILWNDRHNGGYENNP